MLVFSTDQIGTPVLSDLACILAYDLPCALIIISPCIVFVVRKAPWVLSSCASVCLLVQMVTCVLLFAKAISRLFPGLGCPVHPRPRRLAEILAEHKAFSCPAFAVLLLRLMADNEPPFTGHFLLVQGLDGVNTMDAASVGATSNLREVGELSDQLLEYGIIVFNCLRYYRPGFHFAVSETFPLYLGDLEGSRRPLRGIISASSAGSMGPLSWRLMALSCVTRSTSFCASVRILG